MTINEFLVKAKVNTYASMGESDEKILEDGSRELIYQEGKWKYRDRYFGFDSFIGQEIVWENGKMVWGMNYYGKILSKEVSAEKIYKFLKKALSQVEASMPFRGPKQFNYEDFSYRSTISGAEEEFRGVEMILYKRKRVYELSYNGGLIK